MVIGYPSFVTEVNCDKKEIANGIFTRNYLDVRFSKGNNRESSIFTYIMMNPSKADNDISDASVNGVIKLSHKLSCMRPYANVKVNIVNLFPFYASDSNKLHKIINATKLNGTYNVAICDCNNAIKEKVIEADTIVLAWGDIPNKCSYWHKEQVEYIYREIRHRENIYVLKTHHDTVLTKKNHPRHPSRNRLIGLVGCYINCENLIILKGNEIEQKYKCPIVIHAPHSSIYIPLDIRRKILLNDTELNKELLLMTDWYVDELFCYDRAPLVKNEYSRLVFDPERFRNDKDESMSKNGMGAIYTKTSSGNILREIDPDLKEELLKKYYDPYHSKFNDVVDYINNIFGKCLIIDAHSFPSKALPYEKFSEKKRPDVCIGQCSYHTPERLSQFARDYFTSKNMTVALDYPYSGSITPTKFYKKTKKVSSIMIEINRSLYMDEVTGEKNASFNSIRDIISEFLQKVEEMYMS